MQKTKEIYDLRNTRKQEIEFSTKKFIDVKVGEFWRYREGMNIGNEISKDGSFKRPCMILSTNIDNGLVLVCPITSQHYDKNIKNRIKINNYQKYKLKTASLIINQVKAIDKKRFSNKLSNSKIDISFVNKVIDGYFRLIKKLP